MSIQFKGPWQDIAELNLIVDESSRGAVLVAAELLSSRLEVLIRANLVEAGDACKWKGSSSIERLFDSRGPLDSFSAKIDMCDAMGLLYKWECTDLHRIRVIRNDFAHSVVTASFDDEKVASEVDQFQTWQHYKQISSVPAATFTTVKERFAWCVAVLARNIAKCATTTKHEQRPVFNASTLWWIEYYPVVSNV